MSVWQETIPISYFVFITNFISVLYFSLVSSHKHEISTWSIHTYILQLVPIEQNSYIHFTPRIGLIYIVYSWSRIHLYSLLLGQDTSIVYSWGRIHQQFTPGVGYINSLLLVQDTSIVYSWGRIHQQFTPGVGYINSLLLGQDPSMQFTPGVGFIYTVYSRGKIHQQFTPGVGSIYTVYSWGRIHIYSLLLEQDPPIQFTL